MKKILVVLLILAVAGGVFAQQGTWSLNGSVEIGARVDFDPDPEVDGTDDPAQVYGIGWHNWDAIRGGLGIGYARGAVYVGLGFNTSTETRLTTTFDGDAFRGKFQFDNLYGIIGGDTGDTGKTGVNRFIDVKRLWGEYKFFDGAITLLAAYRNDESEYWISDKTGASLYDANGKGSIVNGWFTNYPMTDGTTFTYNDAWMGNDLLLVNAEFGGLSFGVLIPDIFPFAGYWSGARASVGFTGNLENGAWHYGNPWQVGYSDVATTGNQLVDDIIKKSIIGVKFEQSPFEFAAQFQLENYGVYFGGRFFAGPITVGLSAMGILDGDGKADDATADPQWIKIGGRVEYNSDGFGGGLKGFYERKDFINVDANGAPTGVASDYYLSTIGVEPFFFYDAIPSHLRFALDVGFYFFNDTDGTESEKATVWAFEPQIFWNFLGSGAGTYWSYDTGIMVRYRMANADTRDLPRFGGQANNSVNFLDVVFKWGF